MNVTEPAAVAPNLAVAPDAKPVPVIVTVVPPPTGPVFELILVTVGAATDAADSAVPRPQVVAKNAWPSWLRNRSLTRTLGSPVPAGDQTPPVYCSTPVSVPASRVEPLSSSVLTDVLDSDCPMSVQLMPLSTDWSTSPTVCVWAYHEAANTPRDTNTRSPPGSVECAASIAMSLIVSGNPLEAFSSVHVAPRSALRQMYPNPVPA